VAFAWVVATLWRVFADYGASVGTGAAVAGALVGRTVASALRLCRIPFGGVSMSSWTCQCLVAIVYSDTN